MQTVCVGSRGLSLGRQSLVEGIQGVSGGRVCGSGWRRGGVTAAEGAVGAWVVGVG